MSYEILIYPKGLNYWQKQATNDMSIQKRSLINAIIFCELLVDGFKYDITHYATRGSQFKGFYLILKLLFANRLLCFALLRFGTPLSLLLQMLRVRV